MAAARRKVAVTTTGRTAPSRARPAQASRAAAGPAAGKDRQPARPAKARLVKAAKPEKVAKAEAKAAAKPAAKQAKADKPRKAKLVRDSFSIPKDEYTVLEQLKERAARAGRPAKKSELIRAGIQALAGMADAAFLGAVAAVPSLKTGRPPKA